MDSSQNPNDKHKPALYPEVDQSIPDNPFTQSNPNSSSSPNLYPAPSLHELVDNPFADNSPEKGTMLGDHSPESYLPSAPPEAHEEVILRIPGAILHLIDKSYSVELACGDFTIYRLLQGQNVVAVVARVADEIQWPLAKDEAAVKIDDSHYFFCVRPPKESSNESGSDSRDEEEKNRKKQKEEEEEIILNYGLTIASKGQEALLEELDRVLTAYSCFTVQRVSENVKKEGEDVLDVTAATKTSPTELKGKKKEEVEKHCAAYWTTLAPNVEDYSGKSAKLIAMGTGQLIKGILWCGDVTVDRLKKGNEVLKNRMTCAERDKEISPETLKRIERVKKVTKMTEKVATGILSGVVKVSGFFTSSVANSKPGKKFFSLLPGEIVLASLDGFSKICDAVEVAGKSIMSTSSTVTTELVDHRYGAKAAEAANEGLDAAGHAVGAAWAAFKIRQAFNPKNVLKPKALAKAAAAEIKAKKGSK